MVAFLYTPRYKPVVLHRVLIGLIRGRPMTRKVIIGIKAVIIGLAENDEL